MKLIRPSYEILEQKQGIEGIYEQIELAGRTCYKSEDKITEGSAKKFVDTMIRSGHGAMLEHGTVYLKMLSRMTFDIQGHTIGDYKINPYSIVIQVQKASNTEYYITTNLRVLVDNDWLDDLRFLCDPTEYHEKRVTVKFTCDRVTGESFLRHREIDEDHPTIEGEVTRECEKDIDSFARESTRFCNYSKEKFGKELSIVVPPEFSDDFVETSMEAWNVGKDPFRSMCGILATDGGINLGVFDTWLFGNLATEWAYFNLLRLGQKPEQARRILPLDIKSPLVMTAFVDDWGHFFYLRCAKDAHVQARELAIPLKEDFIKRGYL